MVCRDSCPTTYFENHILHSYDNAHQLQSKNKKPNTRSFDKSIWVERVTTHLISCIFYLFAEINLSTQYGSAQRGHYLKQYETWLIN